MRELLSRNRTTSKFALLTVLLLIAAATLALGHQPDPREVASAGQDAEPSPAPTFVEGGETYVAVPVRLVAKAEAQQQLSPKGTQLWRISSTSGHDLPVAARRAYEKAAGTMKRIRPGCGIRWWLLAGIGRVESDHGRYGGSRLGNDGVSRPQIRGIALNGVGPVAAIHDSDNGRLDGDRVWDRAVGPMQFIPTTWAGFASDGDADGVATPNDIDDAALGAAKYLCGSASLRSESGMRSAVYRYNHSDYYVDLVMAFARGYETGVFNLPEPPVVEVDGPAKRVSAKARVRKAVAVRKPDSDRSGSDTRSSGTQTSKPTASTPPKPAATTKPKPTTTTKPSETADPCPASDTYTGSLIGSAGSWSVQVSASCTVDDVTTDLDDSAWAEGSTATVEGGKITKVE